MRSEDRTTVERLLDAWAESRSDVRLSDDTAAKIRAGLGGSLQPVRVLPSRRVLALELAAIFALGSVAVTALLDKAGLHLMSWAQIGWMTGIFAAAAVLFSFAVAGWMIPGTLQRLPFGWKVALSGIGIMAGFARLFPWRAPAAFVSEGWPCALMEAGIAVVALPVLVVLARRGARFSSAELGASLASLAALLALVPLQFQCMFLQAPHLLVWHFGIAAMLVGMGAWAGRSWQ